MRSISMPRASASVVFGLAFVSAYVGACGDDRDGFGGGGSFPQDAAVEGSTCPFQCSLDGRAVVRSCTGEVVTTCPEELACGAALCQEPCAAAAADRSSNGCEFYLQTPRFMKAWPQSCYAAYIVNTSAVPVQVSLELEGRSIDVSRSIYRTQAGEATLTPHSGPIAPGDSAILFVSDRAPGSDPPTNPEYAACPRDIVAASYADPSPDGTGIGASFHLTTNVPVSLAAMYPFGGATSYIPGAMLLLPVATWAKEHIIVNAWEGIRYPLWPGAQIVASEDDTEVTIVPTRDIQDGQGVVGTAAQVPATYHLGKGQHLQLVQTEELSGSIVSSSKPTSVFGGHVCANVPSTRTACEVLAQQIPAFEQWGAEYVGVGYRPRTGDEHEPMLYRFVAARDGTRLDYDPIIPPGAPVEMSAGEVATFVSGTGDAFVVRSQDVEHPIYVAAYMSGASAADDILGNVDFSGVGDPDFVNVVPGGQYLNSYSFYADPTYAEASLVIVRAKTNGVFKDVWLECAGTLTDFHPIGTRHDYEFTRVDLAKAGGPGQTFGDSTCTKGLQRMKSEGPFTATLWGWDYYASYAYPSGMAQRKLVSTPLLPVH